MQIGTNRPIDQQLQYIIANNNPTQDTLNGLKLLLKLYDNLQYPDDKFRMLYFSNTAFSTKVLILNGVDQFLLLSGFTVNHQGYYYEGFVLLQHVLFILKQEIESFKILNQVDPVINQRMSKYDEEQQYKQKMIQDFEANKREVYQQKMEEARRKR